MTGIERWRLFLAGFAVPFEESKDCRGQPQLEVRGRECTVIFIAFDETGKFCALASGHY